MDSAGGKEWWKRKDRTVVRENGFSIPDIGVGVGQELDWMSQVVIDEILRIKEVQAP